MDQGIRALSDAIEVSTRNIPTKLLRYVARHERILLAFRPSATGLIVAAVKTGLVCVLGFILSLLPAYVSGLGTFFHVTFGLVVWVSLFALVVLLVYLSWQNTGFLVTDQRVLGRQGVFRVLWVVLPIQGITAVHIRTGLLSRLFGLETVVLTAPGSGCSLVCPGVDGSTTEKLMADLYAAARKRELAVGAQEDGAPD
jgi:membrane protein YdbS with pleckstrin-like domain